MKGDYLEMSIMKILKHPDPRLRLASSAVVNFNKQLTLLVNDMLETMRKKAGVGLAAPQIGVLEQIVVIEYKNKQQILINPKIISGEGSDIMEEACLSVPEQAGYVDRFTQLTVQAQDINGKVFEITETNYFARIIQHELDHLKGVLFIDKIIPEDQLERI
jgi:peptide deformylase